MGADRFHPHAHPTNRKILLCLNNFRIRLLDQIHYQPPALVRVAAIVDLISDLEKKGVTLAPSASYQPGDPVDWSNGRVS
jgi:hypothetical protein